MNLMKTFIDAGVLITAWRGQAAERLRALTVLSDSRREFVSSPFVQLEVLPKAQFHKQNDEIEFYETFFSNTQVWITDCDQITARAMEVSRQFGLSAMDGLHIAAALLSGATEFITAERATSPFSRVTGITVKTVRR
ncbi:MAG: PIN domain-containing protein [Acidobacteriota bacterium]|nr:PIN domain-containing protein [Acidobacteriota bacterium]